MLKVRTYLDRSEVHGIGIFAAEDIAEGQIVWEFHPAADRVISSEEWDSMSRNLHPASFNEIAKYSYKENKMYIICFDNAQFMNHDEKLNNVLNIKKSDIMIAAKDIRKGEELFCNYFEFCDSDDPNLIDLF